jgi:hypothetical protein
MIMKLKIRGQGPRGAVEPVKKKSSSQYLFLVIEEYYFWFWSVCPLIICTSAHIAEEESLNK